MTVLRSFTILLLFAITTHTLITIATHGWDFVTIFLADLTSLSWRGQFALDFMSYLMLSGLWVAWRGALPHSRSPLASFALSWAW